MALLQISEPGKSQDPHEKKYFIGIDLGTTNSLVAVYRNGSTTVLKNYEDKELFPSVVTYEKNLTTIGDIKPRKNSVTFRSVKRLMGKNSHDLEQDNFHFPCEYFDDNNIIKFKVFKKIITPVEISAEILKHLKKISEETLDGEIEGCVITVPAYFDDAQRQATKDAAALSGLKVLRLLNEPTAAAIAYGLRNKKSSKIMVYDLGGGTFDVSILDLKDGVFKVLSTGGDSNLGGDDIDSLVAKYIEKKLNLDLSKKERYELYLLSKEIKIMLSTDENVKVNLDQIGIDSKNIIITKKEFNDLIEALIKKTLLICKQVLSDANLSIENINEIILVGGSTKTPYIKSTIENFFKKTPLDNINPDNVVAIGASIQANILSGNSIDSLLLLDVTPLSLGIETMGDLVEVIIPRNSTIPNSSSKEYTTFKDGQSTMSIHVVQGERDLASDCRSLAKFKVSNIPPMLAGAARIEIEFQIDADGILNVTAKETSTNQLTAIEVKPSYGLSDSEIEKMLKDSFKNAKDDIEMRNLKESIVEAERVILAINSALSIDGKNLLNNKEYDEIIDARDKLKDNLKNGSRDIIVDSVKNLETISEIFISRRMNSSIKKIMKGKEIKEYK
tara:strand:+ start:1072 stop:2919 length:1848 start_codon:yes stop_codon:yes gene_type:complete